MLNIKHWTFWIWITLACTLLNLFFFVTSGGILSLILAAFCGYGFYSAVKQ